VHKHSQTAKSQNNLSTIYQQFVQFVNNLPKKCQEFASLCFALPKNNPKTFQKHSNSINTGKAENRHGQRQK